MPKHVIRKSLADEIIAFLSTGPTGAPDNDETAAKVVDFPSDEDEDDAVQPKSAIRRRNVSLLDELDAKYSGKRASRKDFNDDDFDASEHEGDDQLEAIFQEPPSTDEEEDDEEEVSFDRDAFYKENASFTHINADRAETLSKKGRCVQEQIRMWEHLLEMRIQMQKCLIASNKLPQNTSYQTMRQDTAFSSKATNLTSTLSHLVSNMMDLQTLLIKQYPDSKNVLSSQVNQTKDVDDEEIASDTDEEDTEPEITKPRKQRKASIADLEVAIDGLHTAYTPFRNATIRQWNDRTQLIESRKKKVNIPILNQIEHILLDKQRLRKRTQLMRSEYRILGETEENAETEYNDNIFDDDDFYHQLLRELIEVKSADITDPIQLSRQWIQLQNMRSKMKRKIDTRATKGRRIRYGVHSKLVNFMAPIDEAKGQRHDAELFQSVFGGRA